MRRLISLLIILSFSLNNVSFAFDVYPDKSYQTGINLSPTLVFNELSDDIDIPHHKFMGLLKKAEMALENDLLSIGEEISGITDLAVLKEVFKKQERFKKTPSYAEDTKYSPAKITITPYYEGVEHIGRHIFYIPVSVEKKDEKTGNYLLLFSTKMDGNKGFPIRCCTVEEIEEYAEAIRSRDVLPNRQRVDAEEINVWSSQNEEIIDIAIKRIIDRGDFAEVKARAEKLKLDKIAPNRKKATHYARSDLWQHVCEYMNPFLSLFNTEDGEALDMEKAFGDKNIVFLRASEDEFPIINVKGGSLRVLCHTSPHTVYYFLNEPHYDWLTGKRKAKNIQHRMDQRRRAEHIKPTGRGLRSYEVRDIANIEEGSVVAALITRTVHELGSNYGVKWEVDEESFSNGFGRFFSELCRKTKSLYLEDMVDYIDQNRDEVKGLISAEYPDLTNLKRANLNFVKGRDYAAARKEKTVFTDARDIVGKVGNYKIPKDEDFLILHEKFQEITDKIRNNEIRLTDHQVKMLIRTASFSKEQWTKAFASELLYWQLISTGRVEEGQAIAREIGEEAPAQWQTIIDYGQNLEKWVQEFGELLPEGAKMSVDELKLYIRGTTAFLPFIHKHNIPIVITFHGKLLKDYPGEKPLRLYFTAQGKITDKKILDEMLYEGVRLAEAMSFKNPLWQVYLDGRKGIHAADGTSFRTVSTLYGNEELFKKGLVMAKGGDRLDQHRRVTEGTTFEGEENDEDTIYKSFTEAMVVARIMGYVFLSGPDRVRRVDHKMGVILDTTEEITEKWNREVTKDDYRLKPFRTTTSSANKEHASFGHLHWFVTSLGVVNGLLAFLRNPELLKSKLFARKIDPSNGVSMTTQGFGDVGSGVNAVFSENRVGKLYQKYITHRGINNVNCAIYLEAGIDQEQLKKLRAEVEVAEDPDGVNIFDHVNLRDMDKVWLSPYALLTFLERKYPDAVPQNLCEVKEKLERIISRRASFKEDEAEILSLLKKADVISQNVEGMDVNEILFEKANVVVLAAVANVFTSEDQIKRLQCDILAEGANNAVMQMRPPEPKLELAIKEKGILYLRGELMNGGGIFTSKEEGFHSAVEGVEYIKDNMEHFKNHIQGQITKISRILSYVIMLKLADSDHEKDVSEIVYELAKELKAEKERLLLANDPYIVHEAQGNVLRSGGELEYRVALLEAASERAFTNVVFEKYLKRKYDKRDKDIIDDVIMDPALMNDRDIFHNAQDERLVAITAVGKLGMKRAIEPLMRILVDKDEGRVVRDAAAESLGYLYGYVANRPGILKDPVVVILKKMAFSTPESEVDADISGSARWALGKMGLHKENDFAAIDATELDAEIFVKAWRAGRKLSKKYETSGVKEKGLIAVLKQAGFGGIGSIKPAKKAGFIFSERVTFEKGLGILLPKLARFGIKVGVVATTGEQRQIIVEMNKRIKDENKKIVCEENPLAVQGTIGANCYYFRMEGEDTDTLKYKYRSIVPIDMSEKQIERLVASLGKASKLDADDIQRMQAAANLFAIAA